MKKKSTARTYSILVLAALGVPGATAAGCALQASDQKEPVGKTQAAVYGDDVTDAPGVGLPHGPVGQIPGCSATLIQRDVALFAGHCFCNNGSLQVPATTTFTIPATSGQPALAAITSVLPIAVSLQSTYCNDLDTEDAKQDIACAHFPVVPLANVPNLNPVYTGADIIFKILDTFEGSSPAETWYEVVGYGGTAWKFGANGGTRRTGPLAWVDVGLAADNSFWLIYDGDVDQGRRILFPMNRGKNVKRIIRYPARELAAPGHALGPVPGGSLQQGGRELTERVDVGGAVAITNARLVLSVRYIQNPV